MRLNTIVLVLAATRVFASPVDVDHPAASSLSYDHHDSGGISASHQYDNQLEAVFIADTDSVVTPSNVHVKRWGKKKHNHPKTVVSTFTRTMTVKDKSTATLTTTTTTTAILEPLTKTTTVREISTATLTTTMTTTAIPAPVTMTTTVREKLTATLTTTTTTTTAIPAPITETLAKTVTFVSTTPLIRATTTTVTSAAPAVTTVLASTDSAEPKSGTSTCNECSDEATDGGDDVLRYGHRHHHASDSNYHDFDFYYNYAHSGNGSPNNRRRSQATDQLDVINNENDDQHPRFLTSHSFPIIDDADFDSPPSPFANDSSDAVPHDMKKFRSPGIDLQDVSAYVALGNNDDAAESEVLPAV